MYTGFHTAASGLTAQSRILDTMGNNIANADSAGYKKDYLVTTTPESISRCKTGLTWAMLISARGRMRHTRRLSRSRDFYRTSVGLLSKEGLFQYHNAGRDGTPDKKRAVSLNQDGFLTDSRGIRLPAKTARF